MKIGANKAPEFVPIKKTERPESKAAADQVSIGGNVTDESLILGDKLKLMKSGDAGDAIAGTLLWGGAGSVAGGVGAGFAASAFGAGGVGVTLASIAGVVIGGFVAAEVASNVLWFGWK